ncbi:MAG TPA: hypothetical protein VN260_08360, partial [Dissulfurispiraceae bacterium]|nr:hypothetical protein [Dissulfurispiraceae bacterium]
MKRSQSCRLRNVFPFIILFVCLILGSAQVVWSQQAADCNQQQDTGERIKCKFDKVHSQIDSTVNDLDQFDFVPPDQLTLLKNAHARAGREKERATAEGFKGLTKKKKKAACHFKEFIGDGDGICDPKKGEQCEEIIGDGIGDEKQPCILKGKDKEMCVQVCDQDFDEDEENFDQDAGLDIEQTLDDTAQVLSAANGMVRAAARRSGVVALLSNGGSDKCANVVVGVRQFTDVQLQGIRAGANGAKLAADTCDAGCNQDSFGWNCSAVCIAFRLAEDILTAVADGFEMQDGSVTDARVDAMAECLVELGAKLNGLE